MPNKKKKKEPVDLEVIQFGGRNEDSDDEDNLIEIRDNHIYLYSDINNKSAYEVGKYMEKARLQVLNLKNRYDVEPVIHLHINSYGGCLFSGFCIIDTIRKMQKEGIQIYSYCEGKVASAGTLISVVADRRYISKNAVMLIHQLSSVFWGKFHEIEDDWENVNMLMKKLKTIYKENCNFKKKDLDILLKRDLWLEADECKKMGLIDEII